MNPTPAQVRDTFPHWSAGQCKRYRMGVRDCGDDLSPALNNEHYLRGYADAMGDDAMGEDWFVAIADWRVMECWWENDHA